MTMPLMVARILEQGIHDPDKTAIVCGNQTITYRTLSQKINSAATFLKERGVRKTDRVLLSATNANPSFVYGYFACHVIGAISVPTEAKIAPATLNNIAEQTQPRFSCLSDTAGFPFASGPVDCLDCNCPGTHEIASDCLDDTADILFTAGTTGKPKGIVQTHRNIKALADGRFSVIGRASQEPILIPLPLSHGFGLGRLRCSMLVGGSVVLIDGFLYPERIFEGFDRHGASGLCCVPVGLATLFQRSGDRLAEFGNRIKYIETATAPLPDSIRDRLLRILPNTRIYNTYGLTETTATIAYADLHYTKGRRTPVGKPIPGIQIKIADEGLRTVPTGQVGQVLILGDNVMKGYWGNPGRTIEALANGWLKTNDMGFLDLEGYLYLEGRKEELINIGGLKVSPIEVEAALQQHPLVDECACIGEPDPSGLMGETIKAFIVSKTGAPVKPTDADLINFLRKLIEDYKVPANFVWVDKLPKTPVGKLQRLQLKVRPEREGDPPKGRGSLIDVIRDTFGLGADIAITEEDGPGSLNGWDSLGHLKLILSLERTYKVGIQASEAMGMETIADIREVLTNKGVTDV